MIDLNEVMGMLKHYENVDDLMEKCNEMVIEIELLRGIIVRNCDRSNCVDHDRGAIGAIREIFHGFGK